MTSTIDETRPTPDPVPHPGSGSTSASTSGSVERDGVSSGGGGRRRGFGVVPGLDGIRAVAVVLVLLFHQGFPWASGGFLGVSVFFTLSGYLITSLLIAERTSTGGVGLVAFWRRRFRRLLPASLVCMGLVIAFGILAADPTQRAELAGDITASLAYVANWWFLASGQSYADLFTAPSPLLHFWSLAIEEQFYLLLPLAAWAALTRTRAPIRTLTIGTLTALAATIAIPLAIGVSNDWYYYATPTRTPELLTGVLLALLLTRTHKTATNTTTTTTATGTGTSTLRDRLTTNPTPATTTLLTIGGIAALGTTLWLTTTTTTTSPWLYDGGLPAFSLISAILITATHLPNNPLTHLLTLKPIRHIGHISYGIYLFHWPIFLWLTPTTTGLTDWPLFTLRITATLTLAELSYHLIEQPIRRTGHLRLPRLTGRLTARDPGVRSWVANLPLGRLAPVLIAVIIGAGVLVSDTAPAPTFDLARAEEEAASLTTSDAPPPEAADTTSTDVAAIEAQLPVEPPPLRMAMFGDSTALMTSFGLGRWVTETQGGVVVGGATMLGCGTAMGGAREFDVDRVVPIDDWCMDWPDYWRSRTEALAPNLAVVQVGPWEAMDRQFTPDGPVVGPGDPLWESETLKEMLFAVDMLSSQGAYVVWLTAPPPNTNLDPTRAFGRAENVTPERFDALNAIINRLPELRPGAIGVVDTAGWTAANTEADLALRPDGIHVDEFGGITLAQNFLGPAIVTEFQRAWLAGDARRVAAQAQAQWNDLPPLQDYAAGEPLRVLVWSDRRADDITAALTSWATASGANLDVRVSADPSCGVARSIERRDETGSVTVTSEDCRDRKAITAAVEQFQPHVVFLAPGDWEAAEHLPHPVDKRWMPPGTLFGDLWLTNEIISATSLLRDQGAIVVPVTAPTAGFPWKPSSDRLTERIIAVNQSLTAIAASPSHQGWMTKVDLNAAPDPAAAMGDAVLWSVAKLVEASGN